MKSQFMNNHVMLNPIADRVLSWSLAFIFAGSVTVFLIALMHLLISAPKVEPLPIIERPHIEIVLVEKIQKTLQPFPKPIKEVVEPIPEVPFLKNEPPIPSENGNNIGTFKDPITTQGHIVLAPSNLPVARMMMAPQYPASAARNHIEGYVDVRFDITKTGATQNVEVVDAMPAGVFDKAAVNAVKRWKYTPPMQEGEAVAFYGMAKRVVFAMEK